MHIYTYLYIRVRMRICVCVFECEWECVCVCVCIRVCVVCTSVCACMFTHTHTRKTVQICIPSHTSMYLFVLYIYITHAHNTSQARVQMAYQWLHQYILSTQLAVQIPLERWSLSVCAQWIMPTSTCQYGNKSLSQCQTFVVSFILTGLASPGSRQPKFCWQNNTWLRTGSPGIISDSLDFVVRFSWCKQSAARRNVNAKRMQTVHSQDMATKMHVR